MKVNLEQVGRLPGDPFCEVISSKTPRVIKYSWDDDGGPKFKEINAPTNKKYLSPRIKMLVGLGNMFFHSIIEDLASVMYFGEQIDDLLILLAPPIHGRDKVFDYLVAQMDEKGISYEIFEHDDIVEVDNYFYFGRFHFDESTARALSSVFNESVIAPAEPHRKVYISRKRANTCQTSYLTSDTVEKLNQAGLDDLRIDEEGLLELYFSSHGFEILYAEDFETLQDHVNYMNSVKTLVSVFSSGLASLFMMQPNQVVVEIPVTATEVTDDGLLKRIMYFPYQSLASYVGLHYCSVGDTNEPYKHYDEILKSPEITKIMQEKFYPVATKRTASQVMSAFNEKPHLRALLA